MRLKRKTRPARPRARARATHATSVEPGPAVFCFGRHHTCLRDEQPNVLPVHGCKDYRMCMLAQTRPALTRARTRTTHAALAGPGPTVICFGRHRACDGRFHHNEHLKKGPIINLEHAFYAHSYTMFF